MKRHLGVKVELDANCEQRRRLSSYAGTTRLVYNWAIGRRIEHYETVILPAKVAGLPYETLTYKKQLHEWSAVRGEIAPWYGDVSSQVPTQALLDADHAYQAFFHGCAGKRPKVGHPTFHAKGRDVESFRLQYPQVIKNRVKLPCIGWIRLKEDPTLRIAGGRLLTATVVQEAARWYVSLNVEQEVAEVIVKQRPEAPVLDVVGIDLGVGADNYLVCSDGKRVVAPRPLKAEIDGVARLNRGIARKRNVRAGVTTGRALRRQNRKRRAEGKPSHYPSRAERGIEQVRMETRQKVQVAEAQAAAKVRGDRWIPKRWEDLRSNRQREAELTLARTHGRIRHVRDNATHEATTRLIKAHDILVIEGLRTQNMMANHHLARAIADVCPGETRRQFTYKGAWYGTTVIVAPARFPSTQKCSHCGYTRTKKEKLNLSERTYTCPRCGLSLDRDLNSARNLAHFGRREMASRRGEAVSRAMERWWTGPDVSDSTINLDRVQVSLSREPEKSGADLLSATPSHHILWCDAATG